MYVCLWPVTSRIWGVTKRKQHLRSVMTVEGSSKRARDDENWQIKFSPLDMDIV